MAKLIYITDKERHLICVPYSKENLHRMAQELGIKRCWFHKNHYDIPQYMLEEVEKVCKIVHHNNIVEIIRHPEYADAIISKSITGTAHPSDYFLQTQMKYQGWG